MSIYTHFALLSFRSKAARLQGGKCAICGEKFEAVSADDPDTLRVSLDRVFPRSKGGWRNVGNLVAAHKACNQEKGDRLPTGCEIIWLVALCQSAGVPVQLKETLPWVGPSIAALISSSDSHET